MAHYVFEENPNPKAKIAFMIWSPFHYYVYKNIIQYLPEAEFVICDTWYSTIQKRGEKHIDSSIKLLKKNKCFWRVFTDIFNFDAAQSFFLQYEVIASVLRWPPMGVTAAGNGDWLSTKKTILISYGAGKDLNTFSPEVAHFDASLVDGLRTHQYHSLFTNSYIVGNPKFDDWFNNSLNKEEISHIKERLNPDKKTILYLPTHSGLSSLYQFGNSIRSLGSDYNVLVKLHANSQLTERAAIEKFENDKTIFLFTEADDILPLLFLANAVISDSSSAILEALLAEKPLVILETMSKSQMLDRHTKGAEFNQFWYSGGLTFPQSIEQQVKKKNWGLCEVVRKADKNAIRSAIEKTIRCYGLVPKRSEILNSIFAYRDGTAGRRAARAILRVLKSKNLELPVLGRAARCHLENLEKNYILQHQKDNAQILVNKREKNVLAQEVEQYRAIHSEKNLFKKASLIIKNFF